jgi:hypothetical protein
LVNNVASRIPGYPEARQKLLTGLGLFGNNKNVVSDVVKTVANSSTVNGVKNGLAAMLEAKNAISSICHDPINAIAGKLLPASVAADPISAAKAKVSSNASPITGVVSLVGGMFS